MTTTQSSEDQRLAEVLAADAEVRAREPAPEVTRAIAGCEGPLAQVVETAMLGYAERTALGERPLQLSSVPGAGHVLASDYETVTYEEVWRRARSVSTAWRQPGSELLAAGDVVCSAAAAGIDHTVLELATIATGAVSVPVTASAPPGQWHAILRDTRPRVLALDAELVAGLLPTLLGALPDDLPPPGLLVLGRAGASRRTHAAVEGARRLLPDGTAVHTLDGLDDRGRDLPPAPLFVPEPGTEPLAQILYTSGATGDPKGAMFTDRLLTSTWRGFAQIPRPAVVMHHAPMSHIAGRIALVGTLARGGTCFFAGRGDMSTLLEDFALARPTELSLVPRVCEILRDRYRSDLEARRAAGSAPQDAHREALAALRDDVLGGRVVAASNGSALLGDELRAFMESVLGLPFHDGFGTTEAGGPILFDNRLLRPNVIDHKLVDVPELGYFATDRPHPRGELLIKTMSMIPGYFNRPDLDAELFDPDGFYRTGDIVAQTGPDELHFVDRRNNVLKLSQAEFVAVSQVEDTFLRAELVEQIFLYGGHGRSFLLAVVVPGADAVTAHPDPAGLRSAVLRSLQERAEQAGLRPYEIPRDVIIEHDPFTAGNGLLSTLGKPLRQKLVERYRDRLEGLYAELADRQSAELASLRDGADDRPVIDTVLRATRIVVDGGGDEVTSDRYFAELGGDSLSALSLATSLGDVFGIEVPVSTIVAPGTTLAGLADAIADARTAGTTRPTARSVHGRGTVVRADDLTLEAFGVPAIPAVARTGRDGRTVLLTGANGFLGRFLALELLEDASTRVVCLVRGSDATAARRRLHEAFDTDPELAQRFRALSADRLEVVVGDVAEPRLGMTVPEWDRLTDTVDAVVHPAALVNHVLPYEQLFGPNVAGTAEVVRLAVTSHLKEVVFISSVGIADQAGESLREDDDVRVSQPTRELSSAYAGGYATSKWAAEVLLRRAHDRWALPVTVVRSGLILGHRRYVGQLNLPDVFTRLVVSILATGVAPAAFPAGGGRSPVSGGVPVDVVAPAVVRLGLGHDGGYRTLHATAPETAAPSLDTIVDWLVDSGEPVARVDDPAEWLRRWEIGLSGVPDRLAPYTALPLLEAFRRPVDAGPPALVTASRFAAVAAEAGLTEDGAVPGLTRPLVEKYLSDLAALGLTDGPARR